MSELTWHATVGEDQTLYELLNGKRDGFFIDVGANNPDEGSVSKTFYTELGWRGINIEPIPEWAQALRAAQPESITLQVALGAAPGEAELWIPQNDNLATMDADNRRRLEEQYGQQFARTIRCEQRTLADVCKEYIGKRTIDWLKIDVERSEWLVIQGGDWNAYRPTALCIEATWPDACPRPESERVPCYEDWEPFILDQGYRLARTVEWNRFYLLNQKGWI